MTMNSEALQNLPLEMQQRLAQIMAQGQAAGAVNLQAPPVPQQQPGLINPGALAPRPPSLMDHLIELRGETAEMRNEVGQMRQEMAQLAQIIQANSGVVEGVGQAVGTPLTNSAARLSVAAWPPTDRTATGKGGEGRGVGRGM